MSSNSQPRAIPDRGLQTRRQALGSYNMAHLFSTYSPQAPRLELSNHDTSTAVLDQGPHTPDADTPYGSISPLLSSSVPSRPSLLEAYWNQFGRIRTSYRTNHALQYFLGVGEGVAATADHAPYTPSSTGPQSTSFMSLDGDTPQLYVGSDVAVSGSTQPGHRPPPEFEYDSNILMCDWNGCSSTSTFSRRTSLWRHIQDRHLPPEIICPMCFEPFRRRDKYNTHLRRAHSDNRLR